jgi:hypothetical protein
VAMQQERYVAQLIHHRLRGRMLPPFSPIPITAA